MMKIRLSEIASLLSVLLLTRSGEATHLRGSRESSPRRELGQACPKQYDQSKIYKAGSSVSISNKVYQCKLGPESAYCNLFSPDYEHSSAGSVTHSIGQELGWTLCGSCSRWLETRGECESSKSRIKGSHPGPAELRYGSVGTLKNRSNRNKSKKSKTKRNRTKERAAAKKAAAKETSAADKAASDAAKFAAKDAAAKDRKKRNKASSNIELRTSNTSRLSNGMTLSATDDAHVDRFNRSANNNGKTLQFNQNNRVALLQFDISDIIDRDMFDATLRLHFLQRCETGIEVKVVSGMFDERSVSWHTAPYHAAPKSAQPKTTQTQEVAGPNEWYDIDVSSAVTWSAKVKDQRYATFRISSQGDGGCVMASKEYQTGELAPSLEVGSNASMQYDIGRHTQKGPSGRPSNEYQTGELATSLGLGSNASVQYDVGRYTQKGPTVRQKEEGMQAQSDTNGGENYSYNPYFPSSTQEWHVVYSLGTEGQCVMNCDEGQGEFCGGRAAFWESVYTDPRECCKGKLWWMGRSKCVPGYDFGEEDDDE